MSEKYFASKSLKSLKERTRKVLASKPEEGQRSTIQEMVALVENLQDYQHEIEDQKTKIQRSERTLKASLKDYLETLDIAPFGFLLLDCDGNILDANSASSKMLGVEKKALTGLAFVDYIDVDFKRRFRSHLKKLANAPEKKSSELKLIGTDNHITHVKMDSYPIKNSKGEVGQIKAFLNDISQQKKTDQKTRKRDINYQKIVEMSPDLIVIHDLDGAIKYMNAAGLQLLRIPHLEDILDKPIHDLIQIDGHRKYKMNMTSFTSHHNRFQRVQCKLKRIDGSTLPAELTTIFFYYEGKPANQIIARDISQQLLAEEEKKAAQEALSQSEKLYSDLFQGMMDGFAVHEMIYDENGKPSDYRFLEINPAFEHMTGLKRKDIIGKRVLEVLPDLEKQWIKRYGNVVLTGKPTRFESYTQELDSYFEVRAYHSHGDQFACIFRDITKTKQSEKTLKDNEI